MKRLSVAKFALTFLIFGGATVAVLSAQTVTTTYTFTGMDGFQPSVLVQGTDGNFYGTTNQGGAYCWFGLVWRAPGCGTIFRLTSAGVFTSLHSFCYSYDYPWCRDGSFPGAGVVAATDGYFYGTTTGGGAYNDSSQCSYCEGTFFKMGPLGDYYELFSFGRSGEHFYPEDIPEMLLQGADGNFYGIDSFGGYCGGCGALFKITSTGTMTLLYDFCSTYPPGCSDGSHATWLMQAANGQIYGTNSSSGGKNCGTVFKMNAAGTLTSLHSFRPLADGCAPSSLIQANDGNFYGTASTGGANAWGTVFRMAPNGQVTNLYNFCSQALCSDGAVPNAPLVQASDGNFYGTTIGNSAQTDDSVIFSITPDGIYTVLYTFNKDTEHAATAGLTQSTDGSFFGGTGNGVCENFTQCGTLYHLSVGLAPFVKTMTNMGKVGRVISILGTNLTGATGVQFNGTPAAFRVASGTLIYAKVPSGATTGAIQVSTPGGTLSSNAAFRVIP